MRNLLAILILFFFFNCKEKEQKITPKTNLSKLIDSAKNTSLDNKARLEYAQKALSIAKISNKDTLVYQAYLIQSMVYNELGFDKNSLSTSYELMNWSKNHNNKKYIANAYFNLGNYFYEKYKSDSAFYYFNQSKNEYINLKDKEGIAKNSINIAMILNDASSYFESEKSSLEALQQVKNNPRHPYLAPIYNNLAVSSGGLLNYEEELYWYDKALKQTEDEYYIVSIKHNQAVALSLLKEYDQAIKILEEIKDLEIVKKDANLTARVIDNLSFSKWKKNKNYNPVKELQEASDIYSKENDYIGLSSTYDHFIQYYRNSNPEKALDYALKKYGFTNKENNIEGKLNALKCIISISPTPEKIKEYINLSDSVQFINSNSKYQFAKLEHDADKNRETIITLSLENTKNALNFEKAKLSSIIVLAILIISLILFTAYFYFAKEKRKQERLSTIYETEVLLSQKLHDELANDLFSTITLVDSITFENSTVKNKLIHNLDHIYSQTRSISRQTNTVDTDNFMSELDSMLASYKSNDVNIITKGIADVPWDILENQVKIVIYRVLMELMTNMKKHSNCNLVVIKLEIENKNLIINYIDNGVFESKIDSLKRNGLKNMENRILSIKGSINFEDSKGFKASITIPITKF